MTRLSFGRLQFLAVSIVAMFFLSYAAHGQDAAPGEEKPPAAINSSISIEDLALLVLPQTKDELSQTALAWQSAVKDMTKSIVDKKIALRVADKGQTEQLRAQIVRQSEERNELFKKYSIVVNALEQKGGDPKQIEEFRKYRAAILTSELKSTDSVTLINQFVSWFNSRDGGVGILINIVVMIASFMALIIIARLIRKLTRRQISKVPQLSSLLQAFIVFLIYWLAVAVGIMFVLSLLGFDVTPLFALFGGASFIAAFAFQDTLGNLASGLLIMVTKPFDVGDFVDAAGVSGLIENTNIVSTTIKTFDNQLIVVPNSKVWGSIITNVNALPSRRIDMTFGISYDDDVDKAQAILEELVNAHPLVLKEPGANIRMHELADSSVNFICRPWSKTEDYWTVYWDLTRSVKKRFDREGISIPYPQSDVHLHGTQKAEELEKG